MKNSLPKLYVIGDSISIHYGPYLEQFLKGFFRYARKTGSEKGVANLDIPEGANGGDSGMVASFLSLLVKNPAFQPDVLLVNCGLHDIKRDLEAKKIQVPLPVYKENLKKIVRIAKKLPTTLVWVRTTHVNPKHNEISDLFERHDKDCRAYNAAADAIMKTAKVPVVDLNAFTRNLGKDETLFCDHVHFNEAVRERQAAFLTGWLSTWYSQS